MKQKKNLDDFFYLYLSLSPIFDRSKVKGSAAMQLIVKTGWTGCLQSQDAADCFGKIPCPLMTPCQYPPQMYHLVFVGVLNTN